MTKMAYDLSPAEYRAVMKAHEQKFGISFQEPEKMFLRPEWKNNYQMACDAQPSLVTTASSGIPAFLTYFTDPDVLHVLTSPTEAATIFGEEQKGDWLSTELIFPVAEHTYQVTSYGDWNNGGSSNINMNFPTRQPYLFQVIQEYGDLQIERAGLAKIGFVAEQKAAAIEGLNNFSNLTYFYGVQGLRNYGALNDPDLPAAIAPGPKAAGGNAWMSGNNITATANEIFNDIQSLVIRAIEQAGGLLNTKSEFRLALSPTRDAALTATNSFGVNVLQLLKENFPNLSVHTAVQYGAKSTTNNQGSVMGEIMQLFAPMVGRQKAGFTAFNSKLRAGPVVRDLSSYRQKMLQGSAGFVLKTPFALNTMVGL